MSATFRPDSRRASVARRATDGGSRRWKADRRAAAAVGLDGANPRLPTAYQRALEAGVPVDRRSCWSGRSGEVLSGGQCGPVRTRDGDRRGLREGWGMTTPQFVAAWQVITFAPPSSM